MDCPRYKWDPGAMRSIDQDTRKRTQEQIRLIQARWDARKERRALEARTPPARGKHPTERL